VPIDTMSMEFGPVALNVPASVPTVDGVLLVPVKVLASTMPPEETVPIEKPLIVLVASTEPPLLTVPIVIDVMFAA
jgi:hypothetical protein